MEGTLASQKMEEIDLINFFKNEIDKEKLGINIFKGISNANNDLIEMDL